MTVPGDLDAYIEARLVEAVRIRAALDVVEGLGDLVAARRERDGLSLRDVGRAVGVSHVTIRRVELGRRNLRGRVAAIDADTVVRILRWLAT